MINALKDSERAVLRLRSLYESSGYLHFKMSKFEEYDIYAANKDFLAGESIITFTDTNGRLMALKPDVTMSIIRNFKDEPDITERYHYNENVYRVSGSSHQLTEIMQSGLECIGSIDLYCTCEVIGLAAKSLKLFEREYVIDLSHMGIVSGLVDELELMEDEKKELLRCIGAKNTHGIKEIAGSKADKLTALLSISSDPDTAVKELEAICSCDTMCAGDTSENLQRSFCELKDILEVIRGDAFYQNIRLDFSVVQDITYYNGIVFQGFINGVPEKVLTGGRYDLLMRRIGKRGGAIGFGINMNLLERIFEGSSEFDADVAVIYNEGDSIRNLLRTVQDLISVGKRVAAVKKLSDKARYKQVKIFKDGGLCDVN